MGKLDAAESLRQEDLDDLLRYGARELFAEQAAEASSSADGDPCLSFASRPCSGACRAFCCI